MCISSRKHNFCRLFVSFLYFVRNLFLDMIKGLLTNNQQFTIIYFVTLFIDIIVKLNCSVLIYRFISKPFVIILLIGYLYCKIDGNTIKNHLWVFLGLFSFLIGDLLNIIESNFLLLGLSLLFFSLGKIFFCIKFSHKRDFNVLRLIPFSIIMFAYALFFISTLFTSLNVFLVPALLSFFLTLLLVQFTFLRKGGCSKKSYLYVFIGVLLFVFSESMLTIQLFRTDIYMPFQSFLIMMFYGISMYLIVLGVIKEKDMKSIFPNSLQIQ